MVLNQHNRRLGFRIDGDSLPRGFCCYLTNTGLVRRKNEDSLLANDVFVFETDMTRPECVPFRNDKNLYVVADGLGGHSRGELASRTVLEVFRQRADQILDQYSLRAVLKEAKSELDSLVREDFALFGLGTTLAGISMSQHAVLFFSCGDCRVYRLTSGKVLERMTKDHSLVQQLVDQGALTEEQMRFHPDKNIVTATVTGNPLGPEPEVYSIRGEVSPNERYLICSDGVWENFQNDEIGDILCLDSIRDSAAEFFGQILQRGARDNFTLILVEIEGDRL